MEGSCVELEIQRTVSLAKASGEEEVDDGPRRSSTFLGETTLFVYRSILLFLSIGNSPDETSLIPLRIFFSSLLARPPQNFIWKDLILVLLSYLYYRYNR